MEYIGICASERKDASPHAAGYPSHSHDSYELFVPLTDALGFEVEDYHYTVRRGDLLILPPNVIHRLIVKESKSLEYLYVQFTPHVIPDNHELKKAVNDLFHGQPKGEQSMRRLSGERFSYVHAGVKRLCLSEDRKVHEQFFSILFPLLQEILLYGIPVNGAYDRVIREDRSHHSLTDQIIEYVSRHYAEIQDISFVSEVFHYSAVHVNTLIKARLNVSLWQYVLHIRLDRACDMLVSGTHAGDVALSCGFKDYSTFYRMFKKCYGITPTECRRMGKKPKMIG